jgi:hypothetical protein
MGLTAFNRARRQREQIALQSNDGNDEGDLRQEDGEDEPRQIYRGFPNNRLDAGELGLIKFDEYGVALVTPEQAKWLDDAIAVGLLGDPNAEYGTLAVLHDEASVFQPLPEFDGQAERVSEPIGENTTHQALREEAHTEAPPAAAGEEASASLAAPAGSDAQDGANNTLPTDTDDTQELGTGEPSAGDPAEGMSVDADTTVSFINTGWANQDVDAGNLSVIHFDAEGAAIVTKEQAVWLAAKADEDEAAAKTAKPARAKK